MMKEFRMMKVILLFGLLFCWNTTGLANPSTSNVDKLLVKGYEAVTDNRNSEAIAHFRNAATEAEKIEDWQGLIDAGYGMAALGKIQTATPIFQKAIKISKKQNDWKGQIGGAYGLASLPKSANALPLAKQAFLAASSIAKEMGDWRGHLESAKGLHSIKDSNQALKILPLALKGAKQEKDVNGIVAIAETFKLLGRREKAKRAYALARAISKETGRKAQSKKSPPPGWSPVGKSVRGTKKVSIESQRLNRASADKDISNKLDYIKHSEKLEQRERESQRRALAEYAYYSNYYDYPGSYFGIRNFGLYGFGRHRLSRRHLHSWASFHLSRFNRHGSIYIRGHYRR